MAWDKAQMRRERCARMELAGFPDREIAEALQLTPAGLATLKQQPEYRDIIYSLKVGMIRDMDEASGDDIKALQQKIRDHIPAAFQSIFDAVQQRRDMSLSVKAADLLLGIDGRFAKVTRVGLPTAEQGGAGSILPEDNKVVAAIAAALSKRTENAS